MTGTANSLNLSILAQASGRAHSDRKFRRAADLLLSERSGIQGQPVHSDVGIVMQLRIALEMFDLGSSDHLALLVTKVLNPWVYKDQVRSGNEFIGVGYLVVLRNVDGNPFAVRYMSRSEWQKNPGKLLELTTNPLLPSGGVRKGLVAMGHEVVDGVLEVENDPRALTVCSFVVLDLACMAMEVKDRLNKALEKRDQGPVSVEQMLEAMTLACRIRDEIDSVSTEKQDK